jgi:hypothetical protein
MTISFVGRTAVRDRRKFLDATPKGSLSFLSMIT